jgi:hypothetical protein
MVNKVIVFSEKRTRILSSTEFLSMEQVLLEALTWKIDLLHEAASS